MIHQVDPEAITIAEDMSGMPGVASPIEDGGMGFDYRMNMGTPDYWIKLLKEKRDEEWHVGDLFYELTNKREEKLLNNSWFQKKIAKAIADGIEDFYNQHRGG